MLNVTIMTGRLVEDPELRHTNSDVPVASFRIAVRRDYTKKGEENATDFFDVVAWRATAEFVCKYFQKGALIQIAGRIENRTWEDKHGQARVTAEIIADKVYFSESKGKDGNAAEIDPFDGSSANVPRALPPDFDPF